MHQPHQSLHWPLSTWTRVSRYPPPVICSSCGTENEPGRKFCGECGTRLARTCSNCGHANARPVRFCGECGHRLDDMASGSAAERAAAPPSATLAPATIEAGEPAASMAERRLVSVLFADLVGFTARSDQGDPELVREFLGRYFEVAGDIVHRYGGTVEKFIGDAVMAVWGTPTALEDDAERAVRAALDLVEAIRALGRAEGDENLELRAAVLTGEAAVTIGATNQGMVAGDLVNTASRLQAVAPPGTVLVGEATLRAADRAVLFEPVGDQILKGKAAPVAAWRAVRVVAERRGAGRTETLEAPFVGRDPELRLLKDVYHATVRERRARLVSVTGQAGIGKTRLAWEFSKYLDGLVETVRWHHGRSPAYGEGITFWALGEMVRRRAQLAETDDETTTRVRIAETLVDFVLDDEERLWIEPALLYLLGIGAAPAGGRDELFAAWRTFLERIAATAPTVLVFEDLHWADSGLLDFIDHLLDWSATLPILVVTLARPELLDRRQGWGAGRRNFVALSLEPLDEPAMRELLGGLVPGLPEAALRTILGRAGGVPLYAVETIRMLVAEGRVELAEGAYRVVGDLSELRVPESLHALVAARLDALDPADRSLLQDAAVLGQTFATSALAAVSGSTPAALEPRLRDLARREILMLDADPRSPERGQYGFTQALIREVAYSTLAKRERRTRHLAAARYFEGVGDDALAGALATHYAAAYEMSPPGPEADAVAIQARLALKAAADRAAGLGSHEQALEYLRHALRVTGDAHERAELLERAGAAAHAAGATDVAMGSLREALGLHRERGERSGAARVVAAGARTLLSAYRTNEALEFLSEALPDFEDMPDDPSVVAALGQLARAYFFLEDFPRAQETSDRVLATAERLDLLPLIADTLVTRGMGYAFMGRHYEGLGAIEAGLGLAESRGYLETVLRARGNIAAIHWWRDPRAGLAVLVPALELTRRLGRRSLQANVLANLALAATRVGDWDFALRESEAIESWAQANRKLDLGYALALVAYRGEPLRPGLDELAEAAATITDNTILADHHRFLAIVALVEGRCDVAFAEAIRAADLSSGNGPEPLALAGRAAVWGGDRDHVREAYERHVATAFHGPAPELERTGLRGALAAYDDRLTEAATLFGEAIRGWSELGATFDHALTVIDAVTVLGPMAELGGAIDEARATLERLRARPIVERLDALLAAPTPTPRPGAERPEPARRSAEVA